MPSGVALRQGRGRGAELPMEKKEEEGAMKKYLHLQQDESNSEQPLTDPPIESIKRFFKEELQGIGSALTELNSRLTIIEGNLID